MPVLTVENLTKIFHAGRRFFFFKSKEAPFTAVHKVSFALEEGEILGILGPNGAGKTTMIQMLLGTLTQSSGTIRYFGKPLSPDMFEKISHASAYYKFPASLTIQENLDIYGRLYDLSSEERKKRIETLLSQFDMEGFRYKQAGTLSAGQMTRIMLVKAFLPHPRILLLDEPTASLDPDIAFDVRRYIVAQQKEYGVSIILTSHNMQEVAEVCDRALVLQKGEIVREDTPDRLAKSVALTKVELKIPEHRERAVALFEEKKWLHLISDETIVVELEEAEVPHLLRHLVERGVLFTHIEIEKPTLEDFFLHITHKKEKMR